MKWLLHLYRFWPLYLAAAGAITGAGWYLHHSIYESGYAASEAKWQARFDAAERALTAANEKARQKEEDSIALTQKAEAEHEKIVASLNLRAADSDKRLRALSVRIAAASASHLEVSKTSGSASEPDAASASAERAERVGASLSDTGRRCELDAASKLEWQQFYTELRRRINSEE